MLLLAAVEVLRLIVGAEDAMDKVREQYTHKEHVVYDSGRTTDFEVILVNGKPFRKMTARNGKPLPAKEQAKILTAMRRFAGGLTTRTYRMNFGALKDLENTHSLSLESGLLEARPRAGNLYLHRIRFQGDTNRLSLHEVEVVDKGSEFSPGTVASFFYSADGFLEKLEIRFVIKKKRGLQVHTYSGYRKFDAASTITFEDIR